MIDKHVVFYIRNSCPLNKHDDIKELITNLQEIVIQ